MLSREDKEFIKGSNNIKKEEILTDPKKYEIRSKFYKPPVPPKPKRRRFGMSRQLPTLGSPFNLVLSEAQTFPNYYGDILELDYELTVEPVNFGEQELPNEDEPIN